MHYSLSHNPFLRIIVPFVAGIILFDSGMDIIWSVALTALGIAGIFIYNRISSPHLLQKIPFIPDLAFILLFIGAGSITASVHTPARLPADMLEKDRFFLLSVDQIRHKNVSTEILGTMYAGDTVSVALAATLQRNDYSLREGDLLACHANVQPIRNSVIPDAFDYAGYMAHRGYLYSTYIEADAYRRVAHNETFTDRLTDWRHNLVENILMTGLDTETATFIITMVTGDTDYIEDNTRQLFNATGLAHILAVSGLHIAVIFFIISFLLKPLDYLGARTFRFVISLVCAWAFTCMTGLSPSAVRAAIMSTFVVTALLFHQKNQLLNSLCASALLILCFRPSDIYNVGFQLSYLSVAGIIVFAQPLTFGMPGSLLHKITANAAMSIAAQIGTAAISIYYFHTFPLTFLIANIIVVPILPLFVGLSIVAIILAWHGIRLLPLNASIDWLYDKFIQFTHFLQALPFASVDNIWLTRNTMFLFFIAALCLGVWVVSRKKPHVWISFAILSLSCGIVLNQYAYRKLPESGLFLTDSHTSTNVIYYEGSEAYVFNSRNDSIEIAEYLRFQPAFFIRHRIKSVRILCEKPFHTSRFFYSYPYFYACNRRFCFVNGNLQKMHPAKHTIPINYAIVTGRYYGDLHELRQFIVADTIILPPEIFKTHKQDLLHEASATPIPIIDFPDDGPFTLN